MRKSIVLLLAAAVCLGVADAKFVRAGNRRIEATPGKRYRLTRRHGPWMIMVASLRDVPEERRAKGGLSAQEAADEIVLALRKEGIPAYTFSQKEDIDQIQTANPRTGKAQVRSFVAQQDRIVVVAGNYPSAADKTAQATLKYIKSGFHRKLAMLSDPRAGAVYKRTPGRPGPLSRAFLVPNPLLSPEELRGASRDPLLVKLNSDMEHSLLKCPGRYSLVVATFRGKSAMHVNADHLEKIASDLDEKMGNTLDAAGLNAWRMTSALRQARSLGYAQDYEAYVYHDRHQSIVTVGSFDDPRDPRIAALVQQFRAKPRTLPNSGQEALAGEIFAVPRRPRAGKLPDYVWLFDPAPELIEVPRGR